MKKQDEKYENVRSDDPLVGLVRAVLAVLVARRKDDLIVRLERSKKGWNPFSFQWKEHGKLEGKLALAVCLADQLTSDPARRFELEQFCERVEALARRRGVGLNWDHLEEQLNGCLLKALEVKEKTPDCVERQGETLEQRVMDYARAVLSGRPNFPTTGLIPPHIVKTLREVWLEVTAPEAKTG